MEENTEKKNVGEIVKKALLILLIAAFVGIIIWVIVANSNDDGGQNTENREYNEAEVKAAAEKLLKDSVLLNEIYWERGIPLSEEQNEGDTSNYKKADKTYLESKGIKYIKDLKDLTRGVFSDTISESLFSMFLSGVSGGSYSGAAHYIPEYTEEDKEGKRTEIGILVLKTRENDELVKVDEVTSFDYSSIKVIESVGERVKVEVTCTVTCQDGRTQTRTKTVYLIEESDGWRLDSQSKITYLTE